MNTDLLLKIAESIEAQPDKFDLNYFYYTPYFNTSPATAEEFLEGSCGTTACVAGWAVVCAGLPIKSSFLDAEADGQTLLGLTDKQARRLFYANDDSVWWEYADEYSWDRSDLTDDRWDAITAYEAADVLKRIAKGDIEL